MDLLKESFGSEMKNLYKEFDKISKAMKGTSVSDKDIWLRLGVEYKFISEAEAEKM